MRSPIANPLSLRGRRRGFTLIELLVVVVIIAILLAVAIPAYLSQQVKAKDAKAKQYLAYAYRDIRSSTPETNNQFPASASMVSWVQQADPELTTSTGNCYALSSLSANTVVVDTSSTSSNLLLCTKSDSGNVWKLAASPTSAASFVDGTAVPLTVSGNEITDATRAAGMQGDGRAPPDSSTGIWEGTTNLVPNGGFETNTTGWTNDGGGTTVTRDTAKSKFGAASLRIDAAANNHGGFFSLSGLTVATTYTYSVWCWVPVGVNFDISSDGVGGLSSGTKAGTSSWQRVIVTFTTGGAQTTANFRVSNRTAGAQTYWVDGAQVEQKPIATPYVETNGATASRAAARVQAPASLLNATQGWYAIRFRDPSGNAAGVGVDRFIFDIADSDTAPTLINHRDEVTPTGINFRRNLSSVGVGKVIPAGGMTTVIHAWDATTHKGSLDGAAFTSWASTPNALPFAATFGVASYGAGTGYEIDGDVLWFACGTGTISNADAATINGFGNSDPNVSSFPSTAQSDFVWNGVGSNGSLK